MSRETPALDNEAMFRSIVMESPIPIALLVGPDFIITVANNPQLIVWGKGDQVLGLPLAKAIPEMEGQPFLAILDEVFTTGITFSTNNSPADMVIDGISQRVYFDFSFKPIRDRQGAVYGIIATGIEITQQITDRQALQRSEEQYRLLSTELDDQVKQRTRQLEESIRELTRSNENLQQFAYIASHDLQEPLRKVQQFGDLLVNRYSTELGEGITYLERMQSAARRMSGLIRALLSYSRISTQRAGKGQVSLSSLLAAVQTNLELEIQETRAVVAVSELPVVEGDPAQLEQLFLNLLSNALKFQSPGVSPQIQITCAWVRATDLPRSVKPSRTATAYHRIDVVDNGIGFEEKYLDRIFTVFQRLHGISEYAGTGIGLAICGKVVINHGGAITATSQPGQGSTFKVYLPI